MANKSVWLITRRLKTLPVLFDDCLTFEVLFMERTMRRVL
jgi:hypothetical protein